MNDDAPATQSKRPIGKGVATLVVVGTIFAVLSLFSVWGVRQALSTSDWTDTSSQLLENPTIRTAMANYLVDQLYANVDVEGELQDALPKQFQGLAGPAAGGLRQLATTVATKALAQPAVQQAWEDANRTAHEQLVTILDGGKGAVSTANGEVTLNTGSLVNTVAAQLGIGANLASKLPPNAGTLVIMRSDNLKTAQDLAKVARATAIVFVLLALLFYLLAIYFGIGRRRRVIRLVGVGLVIVGVLGLALRSLGGGIVVDSLATTAAAKPAVTQVWDIGTGLLRDMCWSLIVSGVVVLIGAWLAGPTRVATAARRNSAPYAIEYPALPATIGVLIFLLLIWWAPITGLQTTLGIILNAIIFFAGIAALQYETVHEFAGAKIGDVTDNVRDRWADVRGKASDAIKRRPGAGGGDQTERLERLAALKEKGALTDAEYEAAKRQILDT